MLVDRYADVSCECDQYDDWHFEAGGEADGEYDLAVSGGVAGEFGGCDRYWR